MDPTVPGGVKPLYPKRTRDRLARLTGKLHLSEQEVVEQAALMLEWGVSMSSQGRHIVAATHTLPGQQHFMAEGLENIRDMATATKRDTVPTIMKPVTHIRSLRVVPSNRLTNPSSDGNQGDVK